MTHQRMDPEFDKLLKRMKKSIEDEIRPMMPKRLKTGLDIKHTQLQRIIANMNKGGFNFKVKKSNGKRKRFRLEFEDDFI